MKKHLLPLFLSFIMAFVTPLKAQEDTPKTARETIDMGTAQTIGIRLSNGITISHQRRLTQDKQLEFNLGICNNNQDFDLTWCSSYQWLFPIASIDELEYYIGPALRLGYFDIQQSAHFNVGLGALAGVAYTGAMPVQFSLDISPIGYILNDQLWSINLGIGIRYFL